MPITSKILYIPRSRVGIACFSQMTFSYSATPCTTPTIYVGERRSSGSRIFSHLLMLAGGLFILSLFVAVGIYIDLSIQPTTDLTNGQPAAEGFSGFMMRLLPRSLGGYKNEWLERQNLTVKDKLEKCRACSITVKPCETMHLVDLERCDIVIEHPVKELLMTRVYDCHVRVRGSAGANTVLPVKLDDCDSVSFSVRRGSVEVTDTTPSPDTDRPNYTIN